MLYKWMKLTLAAVALSLVAACGGDDEPQPSIAQVAVSDARFSTLVEALDATGLRTTFEQDGNYTVFAPTNTAFDALLTELSLTKAQLLANRPLLTAVLQYHVLSTRVQRSAVPAGKAITPLAGGYFKIDAVGTGLVITDGRNRTAGITTTDVQASNGILHVIDRVLLPADKNIVQTAQALPQFSILVEAVVAADLAGTLSGAGPFTVFAPTNDAFAALLGELGVTKAELLADKPLLTKVLTYHVLAARVLKADVPVGSPVTTVQGETFTVDATLKITDRRARVAGIAATDVLTSNGVIHVIDRVILPAP